MRINKRYIACIALILPLLSFSQKVNNIHFEQVGKQIHIYYDLQGDQEYIVQVFCSTDDGKSWGNQLQNVTGEVGENQKQGNNKKIIWDVLAEREKLSGNIQFKLKVSARNKGTFTDKRDGQTYKWVKIGKQVWMAENLNYNSGNSWCYDKMTMNCNEYGRLYNWKAARTACPAGWHLPSDSEWDILVDYLGASSVAGGKMKEAGTTHWESANSDATNLSGFTAFPGGYRSTNGSFSSLGYDGYWWSATEYSSSTAWRRNLYYSNDKVYRNGYYKGYGFSVRCLRD